MTFVERRPGGGIKSGFSRSSAALERMEAAMAALADCRLCAHDCGVNRFQENSGRCHAGSEARIFCAQTEVSDELELIPTFAIAFAGCDLRCDFCITGAASWNPLAGEVLNSSAIASKAIIALKNGAKSIMILGGEPTVHLPMALEIITKLPDDAKLVWKTNAHGSSQARELLDGMFDVWLADYKFGNDTCALRIAKIPDYLQAIHENLIWAYQHTELIVRHLIMPGHLECCWRPAAEWISQNLPAVKINLRSGFWPTWQASRHPELGRTVASEESERGWQIARDYGLRLIH